jgi:hypothetical protein
MKPSMHVEDVKKQEHQGQNPRPTLECIAPVPGILVLENVGASGFGNPNANQAVKEQGQKDEPPLDQGKQLSGAVNQVNGPLKRLRTVQQAGIDAQVHEHERTERDDASQRVNSPNRKFVFQKK